MRCFQVRTSIASESKARELAEALESLRPAPFGTEIVVPRGTADRWEVGAFFPASPDPVGLTLLSTSIGAADFRVEEIRDDDWIGKYRGETIPFSAGRFAIRGCAEDNDAWAAAENRIVIESSMAFGTGRHGSTKGCICALEELAQQKFEPEKIADIGCGSAILSIAATKIWPSSIIVASDLDPVSVEVAQSNLRFNRVEGRVSVHRCDGLDHYAHLRAAPYELLLANILLEPLLRIVPRASELMALGGRAVLSGVVPNESRRLGEACESAGFTQTNTIDFEGWTTLVFRKQI